MENYDIIIVGAGPAGLSTALHLQQMAPSLVERTLILEKARHPRPKLCGGGVVPDAEWVLGRLGLDVTEVPHVDIVDAYFMFEGRGISLRPEVPYAFRVIHREELDAWLVRKARERGLNIQEEVPVLGVIPAGDSVELVTPRGTYRAKAVIGADGAHSVVRRAVIGNTRSPRGYALVLWATPGKQSAHRPDAAYFDFFCVSHGVPGYVWDFPIRIQGQLMRSWGICSFGLGPRGGRRQMVRLLAEEMARYGYRMEDYRLHGESVPLFRSDGIFSGPRILLVGDAVGVDGLFGEGIGPALGYGRLAAEAIVKAFALGDFSFRDYRKQVLRSELGKALRMRAALGKMIYRLRSPLFHKIIWRHSGSLLRWTTRTFLADWARREDKSRPTPFRGR